MFQLSTAAALQFDVFLGYDGIVPEASWFPVVCEIRNDGPTFSGTVEVRAASMGEGPTRRMPIELPTGTLKRITIPVFAGARGFRAWDVVLLDGRGKIRAGQNNVTARNQPSAGMVILGALPRTPAGNPSILRGEQPQPERQPAVARLLPPIFPDNPLVLEGLAALYLNSERAADLSVPQVEALLAWLHSGGHLVVGLEQPGDISSSPWLDRILPFHAERLGDVKARELYNWCKEYAPAGEEGAMADASLQAGLGEVRDGRVVLRSGEAPLIVEAARGRGLVTYLLFSPEREPLHSWNRLPVFWARTSGVPQDFYKTKQQNYGWSGWSSDGIFGAMLDSRQVHKLPLEWLLVLLCVYLVVIGPLDYFWLKRIRRQMLTWVTFPCYVAAFSVTIYSIGYSLRAGDSELNQLHVVDVFPRAGRAELRGRTFTSIYAPSNEKHVLSGSQDFAAFRGELETAYGRSQSEDRFLVDQAGNNYRARVSVPVWTSVLFVADWWESGALPVRVEASQDGSGWSGTVENRTGKRLTNVRFVTSAGIGLVEDIPPGATKSFRILQPAPQSISAFLSPRMNRMQNAVQGRQYAFGRERAGRLDDLPESALAASLLRSQEPRADGGQLFTVSPGLDVWPTIQRGTPVLFAWSEDSLPGPPQQDYKPARSKSHILWRCTAQTP